MKMQIDKWRSVTFDVVKCRHVPVDGDVILTRLQALSDARVPIKEQDANLLAFAVSLGWRGGATVDRRSKEIIVQKEPQEPGYVFPPGWRPSYMVHKL